MQHYNPNKLDFRATDTNLTRRLQRYYETTEDESTDWQRRNVDMYDTTPKGSGEYERRDAVFHYSTEHNIKPPSSNCYTRVRKTSRDMLRESSPVKETGHAYHPRVSYASTNRLLLNEIPGQYRPPSKPLSNMRKSFEYCVEEHDRTMELSNIQSTLDDLSSKVLKMKKELELKNDRHKGANMQPRQVYEEMYFKQEQQSDNSNEESVSTVIKSSTSSKQSKKSPSTAAIRISSLVQSVPKPKQARGFDFNPYSPRRHNKYYTSQLIRALSDRNSIAMEHLSSSIRILKILQDEELPSYSEVKKLNLKRSQFYKDKKTLVFDLDQTLIHCNDNPEAPSDVVLTIRMQNGEQIEAAINIRPYAITMLNRLSEQFQLMVFTASHSCYADVVLDYLDPQHKLIQHRLYREHCYLSSKDMYVKDLRIINRGLHEMVLIDNAAYSYAFQLQNGIPIFPYYDGSNDFELKALEGYLSKVATAKDVRQLNKKHFRLHKYLEFSTPGELVEQLYQHE